ncbi:hypothetical protein ACGF1Z_17880 [Streptomyces sp. NPDC048018]|uniref:hypothetical protein n=1 Tax=Streptomyces sp. NPDC048018 TaxID=3365499 RepID=UPI0037205719
MSEPLVAAGVWRPVMEAAGYRCQCTGQCGSTHAKGDGRCPREHDHHASKTRGPVHLVAAPPDPLTSTLAAARLPVAALRAWCPACYSAARRIANRAATQDTGDEFALFDLEAS